LVPGIISVLLDGAFLPFLTRHRPKNGSATTGSQAMWQPSDTSDGMAHSCAAAGAGGDILAKLGRILENTVKLGAHVPGWLVKLLQAGKEAMEQ
jgi:hypothetical protein